MKKTISIMIFIMFALTSCIGGTTQNIKTQLPTVGDNSFDINQLRQELTRVDDQLNTLELGIYGSSYLDKIMVELGIDIDTIYLLGRAKQLFAGLAEKQLKKKREDLATRIVYLQSGTNTPFWGETSAEAVYPNL